jgi:predicted acetyltransferase
MKIVTYRELEPKDEFMVLMEVAFWHPVAPSTFEKNINLDIRLKNGPVGFCAVENGRLVGFVGVMDIPTKTVEGTEEIAGGVHSVATNPRFAKRGICKILMDRAHHYFIEKKYNFSFLSTNRTIIAYALYKKMDYVEIEKVNRFPIAYKVLARHKEEKPPETKLNPEKIYQIYQKFAKDRTGFVSRQKDFVRLFSQMKRFDEKKSIQKENGYALLTEMRDTFKVQELVSLDNRTYEKLLEQVESFAPAGVLDRMVANEKLLEVYKVRDYSIQEEDHSVFMVKKLGDIEFQERYGENFHIGMLDLF